MWRIAMPDREALVRRFVADVWNGQRPESAHELVSPGCPGAMGAGPEGVLAWHADRRESFPDLAYEVVDVVADDDRVAVRWRAAGTQRGRFGPVPPTGRPVAYAGATFLRFDADGKIVNVWSVNELFGVLEQLGVRFTPPDGE
jgi:predicted ester cyclase